MSLYKSEVEKILINNFEPKHVRSAVKYFTVASQKLEESDWETALINAGKFVESIIKLLWLHAGESLPERQKEFSAGLYAQKIINLNSSVLPDDSLRLQIPRASIFIYDVTSNRGARHDSNDINCNEMDASTVFYVCAWILSEFVRLSAKQTITIESSKRIIDSLTERRYPTFEEIDGRVYIDNKKFKSATECSLLILYKVYPKRINKEFLIESLKRHSFKKTALKFERLSPFIDIDKKDNILLRVTGRKKAEEILSKKTK